jgi:hypothetical protein
MPVANAEADLQQIVRALTKGAQEHGTPNSFAPAELTLYGCHLSCLRIGQLAARVRRELYEQLALQGLSVTYANRRFSLVLTSAERLANAQTT